MPPPVKPRTVVRRRDRFIPFVALLAVAAEVMAAPRDAKVALSKNNSLPSGTVIREDREIRAENGKRTITGGVETVNGARYVYRVNLVRRLSGGDREEVSVRDSVRDCIFYLGAVAPPPNEAPTPLQPLDLRLRRVAARWSYELDKGQPNEAQRFALAELGLISDLVSVLSWCTSAQPRAKGETWKIDGPRPPGKGYGYVAPEPIECRLDDVTEVDGVQHARIAVNGKFKLERPLGYNGSMSVTFSGTILRRLSDMLDVDASVSGTFSFAGPVVAEGKPATAAIDLPWTLTRTQKIEAK